MSANKFDIYHFHVKLNTVLSQLDASKTQRFSDQNTLPTHTLSIILSGAIRKFRMYFFNILSATLVKAYLMHSFK